MRWWILWLFVSVVMASVVSLLASSSPDGLERVAEDLGFIESADGREVLSSPMPDYVIPGIGNETFSASLTGFLGVIIMFAVVYSIGFTLKK